VEHQKNTTERGSPAIAEPATEINDLMKPYVAPRLEILDIEATRNSPGGWPDAGINYS